jgi:hypothetical protein
MGTYSLWDATMVVIWPSLPRFSVIRVRMLLLAISSSFLVMFRSVVKVVFRPLRVTFLSSDSFSLFRNSLISSLSDLFCESSSSCCFASFFFRLSRSDFSCWRLVLISSYFCSPALCSGICFSSPILS